MTQSNGGIVTQSNIDKALEISERRYRRLFETARDGILLVNASTGMIEDANPFLTDMLGYSLAEMRDRKLWEIGAFKDTALSQDAFAELQAKRYVRYDDLPLRTKDGDMIAVEYVSNIYDCGGVDVVQCNIRDVSARHRSDDTLRATARALKMLSRSNLSLLRSPDEATLLTSFCRIAVETGGYRMAWIGFADAGPGRLVQPIAHYGMDDGYLAQAHVSWADTPRGQGPTGRAVRSMEVQFVDDIASDATMVPWQAEALARGYRCIIALPFHLAGGKQACMTIYGAARGNWSEEELALLRELAADLGFGIDVLRTSLDKIAFQDRLRRSLEQTIGVLAETMDQHDAYTAGHQRRVAALCTRIANALGWEAERVRGLHLAATIHDLGKIGIPAEILTKPRRLSVMEFGLVKEHCRIGSVILKDVEFPWPIAQIVLQHHERLDGTGYPQGLVGAAILPESRVVAVADVVEAMASARPYRAALGIDAALAEIAAHRGTGYDPDVVDACLRLFREDGYKIEQ